MSHSGTIDREECPSVSGEWVIQRAFSDKTRKTLRFGHFLQKNDRNYPPDSEKKQTVTNFNIKVVRFNAKVTHFSAKVGNFGVQVRHFNTKVGNLNEIARRFDGKPVGFGASASHLKV
jgi:hypothetical protein